MSNRKEAVKVKKAERRKFWDVVAKMERAKYLGEKQRFRLEPGTFRVTFSYSPDELGIDTLPLPEQIEKLGLKRALERQNRLDHFTNVALVARGSPTKDTLERIRAEVLENTKQRFKKDGTLDLTTFVTTAGETNEIDQGSTTTTEL